MIELAKSIADGDMDLEALADLPDDKAIERLWSLRGVGHWTADYVLLRGLGRICVFPSGLVGARNNLRRWLQLTNSPNDAVVHLALARWRPYGGLVYFHLLLDRLAEAGFLDAQTPTHAGNVYDHDTETRLTVATTTIKSERMSCRPQKLKKLKTAKQRPHGHGGNSDPKCQITPI